MLIALDETEAELGFALKYLLGLDAVRPAIRYAGGRMEPPEPALWG